MADAPRALHVELLDSDAPPGGIGEPGVPPVAPAIANAIFVLTGQGIRTLPADAGGRRLIQRLRGAATAGDHFTARTASSRAASMKRRSGAELRARLGK